MVRVKVKPSDKPGILLEVEQPKKSGGLYFSSDNRDLTFIKSGCTTLDQCLGGGWARRRISNIVGDRSTGKCIRNAYVISDCMFERLDDFGECADTGQSEFLCNLALNSNSRTKTSHFWKEQVSETVEITTRHGYNIEGTYDHKIMIWKPDCSFEMKRFEDLQIGDVAVIAKSPKNPQEYRYKINYEFAPSKMDHSSYNIRIPEYLDEDLAELLGFYIADGCTVGNTVQFSNTKKWFSERFFANMDSCFGLKQSDIREVHSGFHVARTQLFHFMNHLFDGELKALTARFKYVPKCILHSSKRVQAAFIRGLIDCDSWAGSGGIEYYTASKKLAEQVHLLLLNFGIVAHRKNQKGPKQYSDHLYWRVTFYGKYASLYNEIIGYGRHKISPKKITKSDFDNIPFLLDKVKSDIEKARDLMGWCKNGKTNFGTFPRFLTNAAENITFERLKILIKTFKPIEKWFDLSLYRELDVCNYHFDPIIKIKINQETVDVYDVHVPESHLFWANGFINHNTLLAIEMAANFAFSEPKGKIRYREAESAFDDKYAAALGFPLEKVDRGEPMETVDDLFEDMSAVLEGSKGPELYIVDSLDALSDRDEMERDIDKGSYGAQKAKKLSEMFRRLVRELASKDVTVCFISQVRDNIGVTFGRKWTRSGGRALDFYSSQTLVLSQIEKIKKTIKKVERVTGILVKGMVDKNKIGLPYRSVEFPIMFGYGIDDLGACRDWWKDVTGEVVAKEIPLQELQQMVCEEWKAIEDRFAISESKYEKQP